MLHRRQLKRHIQRTARGRTASAASRDRKGKGIRSAGIVEPGKAILSTRDPIGRPQPIFKANCGRPSIEFLVSVVWRQQLENLAGVYSAGGKWRHDGSFKNCAVHRKNLDQQLEFPEGIARSNSPGLSIENSD